MYHSIGGTSSSFFWAKLISFLSGENAPQLSFLFLKHILSSSLRGEGRGHPRSSPCPSCRGHERRLLLYDPVLNVLLDPAQLLADAGEPGTAGRVQVPSLVIKKNSSWHLTIGYIIGDSMALGMPCIKLDTHLPSPLGFFSRIVYLAISSCDTSGI